MGRKAEVESRALRTEAEPRDRYPRMELEGTMGGRAERMGGFG